MTDSGLSRLSSTRIVCCTRATGPFASFADLATRIGNALLPRSVVLDGEIVCLDKRGHCRFNDLLFRRSEPCFVAFDLLYFSGKDLRREQLADRKHELRRIIGSGIAPLIYADHIEGSGVVLYEKCCELDLEGVVAKNKHAPYDPERSTWFKIRNRANLFRVGTVARWLLPH